MDVKTRTITDKIDAITMIPERYRTPKPPCPKSCKIELTAKCNFKCTFCATGFRLREKKDMDWNFFKRVVREMRHEGVEELGLFYLGESFLSEMLPAAIAYAKEVGYPYIFLTTNGSLATPDKVEACMKAGLNSLKFSFNYADHDQFGEITQVHPKNFDLMKYNMKMAYKIRDRGDYDCGIYASSIHYADDQQEKMEAAVNEILPYVDEHYWLPMYGYLNPLYGEGQNANDNGKKVTAGNQGRLGALRHPLPCWTLFTEAHITHDGKLAGCSFDHDNRFNMGDLNEMGFMEAWGSKPFQELRAANLKGDVTGTACGKCIAYV